MKDWQYHLLNSGIAGLLVTMGSLSSVLTGETNIKNICIGVALGIVTGSIVFLNKMEEWLDTIKPMNKCNKLMEFL